MPTINASAPAPEGIMTAAGWIDALVLAANVAKQYTIPMAPNGRPAGLLRITGSANKANVDLYYNCFGVAVVPEADVTDGSASPEAIGPFFLLRPPAGCTEISFISDVAGTVVIEAWTR